MAFGTFVFFVLFSFLLFLFGVCTIAVFKKDSTAVFTPPISVVIPVYNESKNIVACLDSIRACTYPEEVEMIVVDDGSTDDSVALAKAHGARVLNQNHGGKVEALNNGIKESVHDFVITIDADTVVNDQFLTEIMRPFAESDVVATSGAAKVKNKHTFLGSFQNVEYHHNNLLGSSFSKVFNTGTWFMGALAAYRKSTMEEVGYFKKDTITEDMDIVLEFKQKGYRTINVAKAFGYTNVPNTVKGFIHQRTRWWLGVLQALKKNQGSWFRKDIPTSFLFINQWWWTMYAFISFPLIAYQVHFWFPQEGIVQAGAYLFRWFSVVGPFYVLYKLPEWGINIYNIFGVMSGILSLIVVFRALQYYGERLTLKNIAVITFYFPYTIFLNVVICLSILTARFQPKHFIK